MWKNDGVVGYKELEVSVGTGSPAEGPEQNKLVQGVFITCDGCAGFIPNDEAVSG